MGADHSINPHGIEAQDVSLGSWLCHTVWVKGHLAEEVGTVYPR
jgi:hypothetical protein